MIRKMDRAHGRRVITWVAVAGIVFTGMPPLSAASDRSRAGNERFASSDWFVQILSENGEPVDISKAGRDVQHLGQMRVPELPGDPAQLSAQLLTDRVTAKPRVAVRATRMLHLLDILVAKTASERHERVRRLRVTIVTSAPADGRNGVLKSYIVSGKTRIRRFVPAAHAPVLATSGTLDEERRPGPAADITGRWKLDGQGGCYWDANDDGPDQCQPPEGGGGETCYDNEPAPCATDQELEDYDIVNAEVQAQLDAEQAEYDSAYADYSSFCDSNPSNEGCQQPDTLPAASGPSAYDCTTGCWAHAAGATGWLAVGAANLAFRVWARNAAAAAGLRLSAAAVSASTVALVGSAFMVGWYIGSFIDCMLFMYAPEPDVLNTYWYEEV